VGTTPDGERVVALLPAGGGYAERALVSPTLTVPVPDAVEDGQALAIMLQGLTAWHLLGTSARMRAGESVVVHAGAGGVGTLAVQLAKRWGAGRVIAAASSEDKRQLALDLGADAAIDSRADDLAATIKEAAGGKVDVVLEMVGGTTFDASLKALAPFGRLVTYGMASREIPEPLDLVALSANGHGVIGFWLVHCFRRPAMFAEPVRELLDMVAAGELRTIVGGTYSLADARRAHEDLRARRTVGKLVLDTRA
jgi:NADPH:quinone reductase